MKFYAGTSPMQAIVGMLVMYCDAVNKKDSKKQYRNYRQGVNRSTKMPVRLLLWLKALTTG